MVQYWLDLLTLSLIFGSAATVIAYLVEEAGIVHAASAGLMGVGAYTAVLTNIRLEIPALVSLTLPLLTGALCGAFIYALTVRLSGAHLALATLSVSVVLHGLMLNWDSLTGGPMGLARVPVLPMGTPFKLVICLVVALVAIVAASRMPKTAFGLRVSAFRDDEILSQDLRLSPKRVRFALFLVSSCILSFLGGIYAYHLRFVDPSSFTLRESISILSMALVVPIPLAFRGLAGGLFFVFAPEVLRFVGLPTTIAAQIRQAIFGVLLLIVVWKSQTAFEKLKAKGAGRA